MLIDVYRAFYIKIKSYCIIRKLEILGIFGITITIYKDLNIRIFEHTYMYKTTNYLIDYYNLILISSYSLGI